MAESEEEVKSLLMKMKEESDKAGKSLNINAETRSKVPFGMNNFVHGA